MRLCSVRPFLTLAAALLCLPLSACSAMTFFYSAEAIEGWVVDAETGKPLEGVIVVAHWRLKGGFEGGTPIRELQIFESVTDRDGRYAFPAWGPRFALSGHLTHETPEILLFKQGYKFQSLGNNWYPGVDTTRSEWNGKTVKLERFNGTLVEYAQHLRGLNNDLWTAGFAVGYLAGDFCGWKSFPNMLKAMDELEEKLKPLRLMHRTVAAQLRDADPVLRSLSCGPVSDLLGK